MTNTADNLREIREKIQKSAQEANRLAEDIRLVAVSKTKPAEAILAAAKEGQVDFGENYLQEALAKQESLASEHALKDHPLIWHFLGPIQSNKTQAIAQNFQWVHSVERLKIATRLSNQRPQGMPPLNVCIQVNIDNEPTKSGCTPEEAQQLAKHIASLPNLTLRGLMAIPKAQSGTQPFLQLAQLKHGINQSLGVQMDTLSMGMSNDMEDAIHAGATIIRIGTAIFGARTP